MSKTYNVTLSILKEFFFLGDDKALGSSCLFKTIKYLHDCYVKSESYSKGVGSAARRCHHNTPPDIFDTSIWSSISVFKARSCLLLYLKRKLAHSITETNMRLITDAMPMF